MELSEVVSLGGGGVPVGLPPPAVPDPVTATAASDTAPTPSRDRRQERLNTQLLTAVFDTKPIQYIQKLLDGGASPNATCRDSGASALHLVGLTGDTDVTRLLLDRGAATNAPDRDGRRPAHVAAWEGETPVLRVILEAAPEAVSAPVQKPPQGSLSSPCLDSWNHKHDLINKYWDVMKGITEGSTPLHIACRRTKEACVKYLLELGADVHAEDTQGLYPVDVVGVDVQRDAGKREDADASDGSIVAIAKLLLGQKREPTRVTPEERSLRRLKSVEEHRVTALHTAVGENNLSLIEILLDEGFDVLVWNECGLTPLHLAVVKKFEDALSLMLRHGNNRELGVVNAVSSKGWTLLHLAVDEEWTDGISVLLEENADVKIKTCDRKTVLHMAALNGNLKILKELLTVPDSSLIINSIDNEFYAPIHNAVEHNNLKCIQLLVSHNAQADVLLPDGRTLLHLAAKNNASSLLEYLLASTPIGRLKENKSNRSEGGMTALHVSASSGFVDCVRTLVKSGCDFLTKTNDSWEATPLHMAAKHGHEDVIRAVLHVDTNGSSLDVPDSHGWYPLHVAADNGHSCCVDLMLRAGADLSTKVSDNQGTTVSGLDIVMSCVHQPIEFLGNVLDSYVTVDDSIPVTNPECKIEVDFDLLIPLDPGEKQLGVLEAVLNNGDQELQEVFFLHPIVQTFLHLKSKNTLLFFILTFDIFFALALYLSLIAHRGSFTLRDAFYREILIAIVSFNILVEIFNVARLQKYYFKDPETWIKWCIFLNVIFIVIHPTDYVLRYLMAICILLSWVELLLIIAKYPAWGIYVLMFTTVAGNIIKVLCVFSFLLVGFAFTFRALFQQSGPFTTVWSSLSKVIVMVYELDFRGTLEEMSDEGELFLNAARGFYLAFVLLVSVSLVNLMLGLAVSDIAELKRRGRAQRMAKRVAFLGGLENLLYGWPVGRWECARKRRNAPRSLVIKAGTSFTGKEPSPLPHYLKEAVIDKARAIQQAKRRPAK